MGGGEQWAWELAGAQGLMGEAERGGTAEDHLGGSTGHISASTLVLCLSAGKPGKMLGQEKVGGGGVVVVLRSCEWWAAKSLG